MSNFAELDKFDASQLQGDWAATSGSSYKLIEEYEAALFHFVARPLCFWLQESC